MSCKIYIVLLIIFSALFYTTIGFNNDNNKREYRPKSSFRMICETIESVSDITQCRYGWYWNDCQKISCYKGLNEECDKISSNILGGLMVVTLTPRTKGICYSKFICCNGLCTGCNSETAECTKEMCSMDESNIIIESKYDTFIEKGLNSLFKSDDDDDDDQEHK